MKQLLENWRKFVNESSTGKKLEGYTTKLSREIVEAIKDEDLRAYFAENGKAQFKMQVDALDEIDNVRDLYIVMQAVPEEYWHPPMAVAGKYEYTIGGDQEERKTSDLEIMFRLPQNYELSILSEVIPELKDALRHELEHSTQPTDMLDKVQKSVPDGHIWASIQAAENYYTSESETKAHIAGLYKRAKMTNTPAHEILDDYLAELFHTGQYYDHTEEELKPLILRIRELWLYYLASRYPLSDTGESTT